MLKSFIPVTFCAKKLKNPFKTSQIIKKKLVTFEKSIVLILLMASVTPLMIRPRIPKATFPIV